MKPVDQDVQFATRSVHARTRITLNNQSKAMPIYQTSVFNFDDLDALQAYYDLPGTSYLYTRNGNPNQTALAEHIAGLEGAEDGVATSSGMSAIMAAILTFVQAGDHIICSSDIYGGTLSLIRKELSRLQISSTFADLTQLHIAEQAFQANTRLVITEAITNPLIQVIDIEAIATLCHTKGAKLVCDNTFSTPYLLRPLELGADLVIHSATKYIGGHSDVTAGVVVGDVQTIQRTREIVIGFGASLSPFESWLAHRGAKTLALRFERQCYNAQRLAEALEHLPAVERVYYPGLESHPRHHLASTMMPQGYGAMLSFAIANDREQVNRFLRALQWVTLSPSLASVETTISHPLMTSHRALTPEEQEQQGIHYGLIRVSVGIEDASDLIREFEHALQHIE